MSVLKQIHDDLDTAVAAAYGWPADLDEQSILQRLVDLNHQRAAEEAEGIIRYLRPDYQNPEGPKATQEEFVTSRVERNRWLLRPPSLPLVEPNVRFSRIRLSCKLPESETRSAHITAGSYGFRNRPWARRMRSALMVAYLQ